MMLRALLLLLLSVITWPSLAQNKEDLKDAQPLYGFVENKGQVTDQDNIPAPEVKFIFSLPSNNVVLRSNGFSYDTYSASFNKKQKSENFDSLFDRGFKRQNENITYKFHRVDVEFVGANQDIEIIRSEPSSEFLNYYTRDEGKEVKVRHYGKVTYKNLYPGIDVEFIARPGKNKPVEYNFIVSPGADINQIQLGYNGAHSSKLIKGHLELTLEHGKLTESIPASYWKQSNKATTIRYRQLGNKTGRLVLGFAGESQRKNETLVIDPTPNLDWATYYGGTENELAYSISNDASNNIYVAGSTRSLNSIATSGSHQTVLEGQDDAFLVKFNSSGVRQWATYYGGTGFDISYAVATDNSGNIYIGGYTLSAESIATPGSFQQFIGSGEESDAFLVKFNSSGVRQWGTYIGSADSEELSDIVVASNGDIYISGTAEFSNGVITTSGTHQPVYGGGTSDGFLMKFNSAGIRLWGTFYGGALFESGSSICLDNSGNVYLGGSTHSTTMISTPGAHQVAFNGLANAYIAKFNSNGIRQWATYYGANTEANWGIVSDAAGNIYATGVTRSSTSIATPGAHQGFFGGDTDGYLVKFNSNGVRQWGTYYGGSKYEFFKDIAIDASSNIYVVGETNSLTSIATPGAYQIALGGTIEADALIAKFDSNGVRQWATYYGGSNREDARGVEVSAVGMIYVAGYTYSTSLISTPGSHQSISGGGADVFFARFSTSTSCTAPETAGLAIQESLNICAVKFSTNKLPNCTATYAWNFGDGGTSLDRNPIHVYGSAGTYNVSVQITYNCPSCQSQTTLTKQVVYTPPASIVEDRVINVVTDQRPEVISTAASSFSQAWPLNQSNNTLDSKSSYLNGSQGVWRNNASYVYKKDRSLSSSTDISKDGTFTLEQFNWKYAELNAVPNWIKANTMTKYSPYSFELENKDVLGVSSGAIYDYGGQLPAANGVNMRQDEMAFTSFEFLDGSVAGNWILGSQSLPAYTTYAILSAGKNMAVVDATLVQLENIVAVDIVAARNLASLLQNSQTYYQANEIICMRVHPDNPLWSIIVLKTAPIEDYWVGILRIKNMVTPTVAALFDNAVAHSGKKSLKITSSQTFKQDLLQLNAGKSYWVSGWVSVNNPNVTTPVLATKLGVDIIAKQKNGLVISIDSIAPAGIVIEGWQQFKGSFTCPANTAYIEIKFKPGSLGTAWYDDLRFHPEGGNMKGYVYNLNDYRLQAVLDEENFASYFYYDREGNLHLTKKETTDGIKTLSENISYQVER